MIGLSFALKSLVFATTPTNNERIEITRQNAVENAKDQLILTVQFLKDGEVTPANATDNVIQLTVKREDGGKAISSKVYSSNENSQVVIPLVDFYPDFMKENFKAPTDSVLSVLPLSWQGNFWAITNSDEEILRFKVPDTVFTQKNVDNLIAEQTTEQATTTTTTSSTEQTSTTKEEVKTQETKKMTVNSKTNSIVEETNVNVKKFERIREFWVFLIPLSFVGFLLSIGGIYAIVRSERKKKLRNDESSKKVDNPEDTALFK
jgi:hypothetical protein